MKPYPTCFSRFGNLMFAALAVLSVCAGTIRAQALRTLADARGIHIGVAIKDGTRAASYDSTVVREFNGAVCENAMKWGSLQNTRGVFTFTGADNIVNFALAHGMVVRGHNFIWHQQSGFADNMPAQATVKATRDTMFKIMKTHITTVMNHFKGKIYEWDIVNEAVARDSAGMRLGTGNSSSFWSLRTDAANNNWDFVDSAYTYARQADSSMFLVYNDYDCEGMGKKAQLVYDLVARLKSKKLVDGIGFQCHFHLDGQGTSNGAWDPQQTATNFQRMAALGLRISLTEVDIRMTLPADSVQLAAQRRAYETLMSICLANTNCKNFFVWGLDDASSWIPGSFPGMGAPLLFTSSGSVYTPKSAYYGLQGVLANTSGVRRSPTVRLRTMRSGTLSETFDLRGRQIAHLPYNIFTVSKTAYIKPGASKAP